MQVILSSREINQKIERLAHQLIENCFDQSEIYLGAIKGNGVELAERLSSIIEKNSDITPNTFTISVNKEEPWNESIILSTEKSNLKNAFIVLVDDVLNSGKTMQYALVEILQFPTKAIKTVALVDRKHRRFPIKADFVGLSLSTTLKERVEVDLSINNEKAYLV